MSKENEEEFHGFTELGKPFINDPWIVPERFKDETFENYKMRRKAAQILVKRLLKYGRPI